MFFRQMMVTQNFHFNLLLNQRKLHRRTTNRTVLVFWFGQVSKLYRAASTGWLADVGAMRKQSSMYPKIKDILYEHIHVHIIISFPSISQLRTIKLSSEEPHSISCGTCVDHSCWHPHYHLWKWQKCQGTWIHKSNPPKTLECIPAIAARRWYVAWDQQYSREYNNCES